MILLQLSSGKGPDECARAVALALREIQKQASVQQVKLDILESVPGDHRQCNKSVLLRLAGDNALQLAQHWHGTMQWICESPFRPKHKRKNWFFNSYVYDAGNFLNAENEQDAVCKDSEMQFKTCKASGAGGQHVNTTDSAVQATHLPSGISVKVSSERSQHANKKLARLLIAVKLKEAEDAAMADADKARWSQHGQLERGNPSLVFKGHKFTLIT